MTGRYKAYPEYKDSGVEWLGEIPAHWQIAPFKHLAELNPKKSSLDKSFLSKYCSFLPMEKLKLNEIRLDETRLISDVYDGYTYFENDDVLMAKVTPCFENKNLAVAKGLLNEVGFGSSEIYVLRAKANLHNQFLFYRLQEDSFMDIAIAAMSGAGGLKRVPAEVVNSYVAAFPTFAEQQKIANFLDYETAKIDTLITKQEQLIELLKEKRQAVISHAVTKGLNSDAPMKDSGVEWLGQVPEHWIVSRVKLLTSFVTSGSRGWAEYYSDEGALFFRIANLTRDTIEPKLKSIQNVTPPDGKEGERAKIKKNDLLVSITADLGSVCVANEQIKNGYVSQHVALCRPNKNVKSARWLGYFFLSDAAKEQLLGSGYGGTKIQLSLEDIRELTVVMPGQNEQVQISDFIDLKMNRFAELISKAESAILLMKERKTALISAAVTGKIDVRDWHA